MDFLSSPQRPEVSVSVFFAYGKSVFSERAKKQIFFCVSSSADKEEKVMLQIRNLTITHKKDLRNLIEDFSFVLRPGDKTVLIGEEGNGKSTLLKLIHEEQLVEEYVTWSGEIIRNGVRTGYLAQEMGQEARNCQVYEYFAENPLFYDWTPKELADLGRNFGFSLEFFYSDQQVATLSGGEKVKLQLARILMERPDVLLLDEPSNDIDLETLEWMETFICQTSLPVLYISHDEYLMERTANSVIHLEQTMRKTKPRWTVARVPYRTYMEERGHSLQRLEEQARSEKREYEKQQEKFRRIQQSVEYKQATITRQNPSGGRLLKKKMHAVKAQERRFEKQWEERTEVPDTEDAIYLRLGRQIPMPKGKEVLDYELDQLTADGKLLAEKIHLRIRGPEKVCIIGKNGVGKTTLLKQIAQELLSRKDLHAAYMPQNYGDLLPGEKTPLDFLQTKGDKEELTRIRTWLGSMKFTAEEMEHPIRELSGGQKAKLFFMKMSLEESDVLILDEPTRNFSPMSNPVIRRILADYQGAILCVSHDRKFIEEVCTEVYELTRDGLKRCSLVGNE